MVLAGYSIRSGILKLWVIISIEEVKSTCLEKKT